MPSRKQSIQLRSMYNKYFIRNYNAHINYVDNKRNMELYYSNKQDDDFIIGC